MSDQTIPDPETQAMQAILHALMEPVPAEVPCPPWCRRAHEGHGYRDDEEGYWPLARDHVVVFNSSSVSVELVQLERAQTSSGPVELGPVTAYVFADESPNALTAAELREASLSLVAEELERLTPTMDLGGFQRPESGAPTSGPWMPI